MNKFSLLSAGDEQDRVLEEVLGRELSRTVANLDNEGMKDLPLIREFDETMGLERQA